MSQTNFFSFKKIGHDWPSFHVYRSRGTRTANRVYLGLVAQSDAGYWTILTDSGILKFSDDKVRAFLTRRLAVLAAAEFADAQE